MDILKWNTDKQEWEIPLLGDKLDSGLITPTFAEDVEITDSAMGLVLTSATKRWRVTVDDTGTLTTTEVNPL